MNQGKKIRYLIKNAGYTQDAFAKAMGYKYRSAFTPYLNYEELPEEFLNKALKVLNVSKETFETALYNPVVSEESVLSKNSILKILIEEKDGIIRAHENTIHAQKVSISVLEKRVNELEDKIKSLTQKT